MLKTLINFAHRFIAQLVPSSCPKIMHIKHQNSQVQKLNENVQYASLYEDIKSVVLRLKKYGESECAQALANLLADFLLSFVSEQTEWQEKRFVLGFVPSHKSKIKKRGFEPNALILKELEKQVNLPQFNIAAEYKLLIKTRKNQEQKGLSKKERLSNVQGVFKLAESFAKNYNKEHIIIFDDVNTSGATLKEAKRAVLKDLPQAKGKITLLAIANKELL